MLLGFNMDHGKGIVPESYACIYEFTKHTIDIDFWLLSIMVDEARLGNKADGRWTTHSYTNIVDSLR